MRAKKVRAKTALRIDFAAGQVTVGASRYAMHNDNGRLDFQRVPPRDPKPWLTLSHTVGLKDFLAAAKALGRGPVKVERESEDSEATFTASAHMGRAADKATLSMKLTDGVARAEDMRTFGLNATYLADAFGALGWGYVSILGNSDYVGGPLKFESRRTNGPDQYVIVMPMRV